MKKENINALTKVSYQNTNQEALEISRQVQGFNSFEWVTYLQAKQIGKIVRKGEKSTKLARVVTYTKKNKNNEKIEEKKGLRKFAVFNVEQLDEVIEE